MSVVAQEYGITPRQAAHELEADPEQLALAIMPLRRYAEAFAVWERDDKDEMKAWADNPMMARVQKTGFEGAREAIAEREE